MRKPIEVEVRGLQTPRERIWAAVMKLRTGMTLETIQEACEPNVSFAAVADYVRELEAGGHLACVAEAAKTDDTKRFTPRVLDLVKPAAEAPRINNGQAVTQGLVNLALWRAMKTLAKGFSARELARAASLDDFVVKVGTAELYARSLAAAGYLVPVAPPRSGVATRWRLVRNTGPHAPAVTRRKCVFDRNTGAVVAELQTAQEVCDGLE